MNNRVNYTLVGFLVLFGLGLMIAFTYWLLKPSVEHEIQKYNIYFDESVLGLNIDAPVKYRGIDVGKVTRLRINPHNSEQVEVLVTILQTTPIKSSTVAKLTAQGITGLSYINLTLGDNNAPALEVKEGEEFAIIKTSQSLFDRFEKSLETVSTKLSTTLSRTEELLNDKNQKQIALLLKNSATFMDKMSRLFDDKTIVHFQSTLKNLDSATLKLDKMFPTVESFLEKSILWEDSISTSLGSIMVSYLSIKGAMEAINIAVTNGDFNVKELGSDIVPTMNNSFLQMQQLMINLEGVLNKYERSPGDMLFKQETIKKGPGEE